MSNGELSKNATFEHTELTSERIDCGGMQLLGSVSALWFCGTGQFVYCTKINWIWYAEKKKIRTQKQIVQYAVHARCQLAVMRQSILQM